MTGTGLAEAAAVWSGLVGAPAAAKAYPRIGTEVIAGMQARISHLSHLDDVLGSGKLRDLAAAELRLITGLLTDTIHTIAVGLIQIARAVLRRRSTPKTAAILHAREARALSKLNDPQRCYRALDTAFGSLTTGCDDEPAWCYWINDSEIHMLAGSCVLDLGHPHRALEHLTTAQGAFDTDSFPGGAAIYLARAAQAHLALGPLSESSSSRRRSRQRPRNVNGRRGTCAAGRRGRVLLGKTCREAARSSA